MKKNLFDTNFAQQNSNTTNQDLNTSSSFNRINHLTEKLSNISQNIESEMKNKNDFIERKTTQLENKLKQNRTADESKFKILRDNLNAINDELENEKQLSDLLTSKKSKESQYFIKNQTIKCKEEREAIDTDIDDIYKQFEKHDAELKSDLNQIQRIRTDAMDRAENETIEMLNRLSGAVLKEKKYAEESFGDLKKKVEEDLSEFKTMISHEQNIRVENENNLQNLIKDMHMRLSDELKIEKVEREKSEVQLLSQLEDTCNKIERSHNI